MAETTSSSSSRSSITNIADDHIFSILQLLPIDSILSFGMTCKRLNAIASSDTLWEIICRRDLGNSSVEGFLASTDKKFSWKRVYQQVFNLGSVSCFRLSSQDGIFPRPRASHSLNLISECLVLFGGGYEDGRHLDDTWVACIGNEVRRVLRWQQTNLGIPSGRFGQSCIVIGDDLVLFGGINDNGIRHNDTWIGHVLQDEALEIKLSWRLLDVGPFVPPPRGAHAGCCVGDKRMVIHGGIGLGGIRLNDTWLLELSDSARSASWQEIRIHPSPPARSGHTLTWIGGTYMILFGGRGSGYEVLNDIWLLDVGTEGPEWVELKCDLLKAPDGIPLPRVGHSATLIIGGRVLIYGGEDSYRHRKDDFWVLNPSAVPTFKMRSQMQNLKRSSGKMWTRLKVEGQMPDCRSFHRACADRFGHHVYIFGGMVDGVLQPAELSGLRFDGELYLVKLVLRV
ncbi:F-box/kelch-repeat protein [Cinnamomum micranthum f. kanehirae]|uniref:F-box/kelch-repeat protein n=1 Tax=Cinnamomum micranthum f. kanehirae TaxID=337451 RepID=A0A443N9M6_9MAGN|nr:F-box/kelch-repeat protein [Cinnamomum micranthum f. kanehirae]